MAEFSNQNSIENLSLIAHGFHRELRLLSKGSSRRLSNAATILPKSDLVRNGEVFQVLLIGGSHIESALVTMKNGQTKILKLEYFDLPKLTSKEQFQELFYQYLNPKVQTVALNFAFPLKPVTRGKTMDGILTGGVKGHTFDGLVGKMVGKELESFIQSTYNKSIDVIVCNNIVSLGILAGDLIKKHHEYSYHDTIAGVISTGLNFGLFVAKDKFLNLETGNFALKDREGIEKNTYFVSESGKHLDAASTNPGQYLFEKEVGGAYLPQHFNFQAEQAGLSTRIQYLNQLVELAQIESLEGELAQAILQRSAALAAAQIAGLFWFKQEKKPGLRLTAIIEGDLFWKTPRYKFWVEKYLETLGIAIDRIHFIKVAHGFVLGAVGAAITVKKTYIRTWFDLPELVLIWRNYLYSSNSPPLVR